MLRTSLLGRLGYINWLWYTWGATMINQYRGSDVQVYGDQGVLEYYSLKGASEWAFLGYAALTFVFFFAVTLVVRLFPPCLLAVRDCRLIALVARHCPVSACRSAPATSALVVELSSTPLTRQMAKTYHHIGLMSLYLPCRRLCT